MHLKRWITGLAALPILIFLVVKGGMAFYGLVTGVALLALQEYYRIVFSGSGRSIFGPIPLTGFILTPMIILGAQAGLLWTTMGLLGLNLLVVALISIVRFNRTGPKPRRFLLRPWASLTLRFPWRCWC